MFDQKKYNQSRKAEKRAWMKKNTKSIVGVRVLSSIATLESINKLLYITQIEPNQFFYHKKRRDPYILWPTERRFHIPLSLTKRARITINVNNGNIIAKTEKCFKQ